MKTLLLASCSLALASSAWAQSHAASRAFSDAATHSGEASVATAQGVGSTLVGGLRIGSAAAAVPVWLVGTGLEGVGSATQKVGNHLQDGGEALWDAAAEEQPPRPTLDRKLGLPQTAPAAPPVPTLPAPAAALRATSPTRSVPRG